MRYFGKTTDEKIIILSVLMLGEITSVYYENVARHMIHFIIQHDVSFVLSYYYLTIRRNTIYYANAFKCNNTCLIRNSCLHIKNANTTCS